MAINVKLEAFEGPLDLLLYLIEKNKVDIYDIPIVEITQQYLDYIRMMREKDMDIMSEFLVMAATLLDIKCKMLLPKSQIDEEDEGDPRTELVEKLLEYKMYKFISYELKDSQFDAAHSLYKKSTLPEEVKSYVEPINYDELLNGVSLSKINEIFRDVLRRQENRIDPIRSRYGRIEKDEINMDAKAAYIRSYIEAHKRLGFRELLENQNSKMETIVTFLVVLEMIKMGYIMIRQDNISDEIMITRAEAA